MLDDKGNTAVYLLYAYTRIKSIARKAGVTEEQLRKYMDENPLSFDHEKEMNLAKVRWLNILQFQI
jgi:arginyl-tRNA synthetase